MPGLVNGLQDPMMQMRLAGAANVFRGGSPMPAIEAMHAHKLAEAERAKALAGQAQAAQLLAAFGGSGGGPGDGGLMDSPGNVSGAPMGAPVSPVATQPLGTSPAGVIGMARAALDRESQPTLSVPSDQTKPPEGPGVGGTSAGSSARATGPNFIYQGLKRRGFSDAQARAFMLNMRDESGFDPAAQEKSPMVPGSRGGFGLLQWTGPRRVALEEFASERGVDPSDVDLQLDFLLKELTGTEGRAWADIQKASATPHHGDDARAIVERFLRPAPEHRDRRSAAYMSLMGDSANAISGNLGGMEPDGARQPDPLVADAVDSALNGEVLTPGAAVGASMSAKDVTPTGSVRQSPQSAQRHGQVSLERVLQVMQNPHVSEEAKEIIKDVWNRQNPDMSTEDITEYRYAVSQGYEGTFPEFMAIRRSPGTTINNMTGDGRSIPDLGKLGEGYDYVRHPETGQPVIGTDGKLQVYAIPGSKAAVAEAEAEREAAELEAKQNKQTTQTTRAGNVVLEDIARVRNAIQGQGMFSPVTGLPGRVAGMIPGSDAYDARQIAGTIRANIGFDRLQQMREASPTGGALGAVSERELGYLQSVLGELELSQSAEQVLFNLNRLEDIYLGIIDGVQDQDGRTVSVIDAYGASAPPASTPQDLGGGVRILGGSAG